MADYSNGVIAASYGIQGVAELGSAYAQSEALRQQGEFQRDMVEINNRFAAMRAEDALKAGERKAQSIRRKARSTVGAQRAAAAAQGLDVSDAGSSVLDQIYDTQSASEDEVITAKNNAWREAWGYKTQAALNLVEADTKKRAADFAANQTLVTGGLQAINNFTRMGVYAAKQSKDSSPQEDDDMIEGFSGSLRRSEFEKRKKKSIFGIPSLTGDD